MPWWFWIALVIMLAMFTGVILLSLPDKWPRNRRNKK